MEFYIWELKLFSKATFINKDKYQKHNVEGIKHVSDKIHYYAVLGLSKPPPGDNASEVLPTKEAHLILGVQGFY